MAEDVILAETAEDIKNLAEAEAFAAKAKEHEALARVAQLDADLKALELERDTEKRRIELTADRYFHRFTFGGEVNGNSVSACINTLGTWERLAGDNRLSVELVINSPGGAVFPGMALVDYLSAFRTRGNHVTTLALGMAASMGGVLLQAGDVRAMGANAFLLIHEASFGVMGSFGNVQDEVKLVEMMQDRILDIFSVRSNLSKAQIKNRWHRKDWWMPSTEALKLGFVDEVR